MLLRESPKKPAQGSDSSGSAPGDAVTQHWGRVKPGLAKPEGSLSLGVVGTRVGRGDLREVLD